MQQEQNFGLCQNMEHTLSIRRELPLYSFLYTIYVSLSIHRMCLIIAILLRITFNLLDGVEVCKIDFICDQHSHMQHPVHAHLVIVTFPYIKKCITMYMLTKMFTYVVVIQGNIIT